jgi:hypothetical protein
VLDPIIDLLAEVSQGFGRMHRGGLGESPRGRADLRRNRWIMAFLILLLAGVGLLVVAAASIWWLARR